MGYIGLPAAWYSGLLKSSSSFKSDRIYLKDYPPSPKSQVIVLSQGECNMQLPFGYASANLSFFDVHASQTLLGFGHRQPNKEKIIFLTYCSGWRFALNYTGVQYMRQQEQQPPNQCQVYWLYIYFEILKGKKII